MSVYLSSWLEGEDTFITFCEDYFSPRVELIPQGDAYVVSFHLFSPEGEKEINSIIPSEHKNEFFTRFNNALQYFVKNIGFNVIVFIDSLIKHLNVKGPLSDEQKNYIQEELSLKLLALEISEGLPLYIHLSSIIFYGTWHQPLVYRYIIPNLL